MSIALLSDSCSTIELKCLISVPVFNITYSKWTLCKLESNKSHGHKLSSLKMCKVLKQ